MEFTAAAQKSNRSCDILVDMKLYRTSDMHKDRKWEGNVWVGEGKSEMVVVGRRG